MARRRIENWIFDPREKTIDLLQEVRVDQITSVRDLTAGKVIFLAADYLVSPMGFRMEGTVFHLPIMPSGLFPGDELEIYWDDEWPLISGGGGQGVGTANPNFSGKLTTEMLRVTKGSGQVGQILMSVDNAGNLAWTDPNAVLSTGPATEHERGTIRLAGDLGGTADAPTVPGKADTESPHFTGTVWAQDIRSSGRIVTTGLSIPTEDMGDGKVLISDAYGNAEWAPMPSTGEGGGTFGFVHNQAMPSAEWVVTHTLGRKPLSSTVVVGDEEVLADVKYPSEATVIVTFSEPRSGTLNLV